MADGVNRASVLERLTAARRPFVRELSESLTGFHVTGVTGEAEVGKTTMIHAALGMRSDIQSVRLDLDAVYSPNRLVWLWARALARATMPGIEFSHVDALPERAWPARTRSELASLEERVGPHVARLAEQPHPATGTGTLDAVGELMHATITMSDRRRVVLVIDHLEAPSLGFRHPVDSHALLWQVRSAAQHAVDLRIVLVARPPAVDLATGRDAAFYGDGQWLTLGTPSARQFADATDEPYEVVAEVLQYTAGHVAATLDVLDRMGPSASVHDVAANIATDQVTLAARTVQNARSLHRLGGHLVLATAAGRGPYEATPDASSKDVSSAMRQLHMGGIIRRANERVAAWELTDPRVAWALTGAPRPIRDLAAVIDASPTAGLELFACHASRDNSTVREFMTAVQEQLHGSTIWLDEKDLAGGDVLKDRMRRSAMDAGQHVVVFLSDRSVESPSVRDEVQWAIEQERNEGRAIVRPVLLDDDGDAVLRRLRAAWSPAIADEIADRVHVQIRNFTEHEVQVKALMFAKEIAAEFAAGPDTGGAPDYPSHKL